MEPERFTRVLLQQGLRSLAPLRRKARQANVPVQDVPLSRLNRMARGLPHQGVVAIRAELAYKDMDRMLHHIAASPDAVKVLKPRLLVLDGIQDPRNFGALIRTAVAAGVCGIIVGARHMAPISAVVIKASAGTAMRIGIARTQDLPSALYQLKERGYYVAGSDAKGDVSVWSAPWDRPTALVVGSEGKGLSRQVTAECDCLVTIPMPGEVDSLNVSVAAAIILFAATRPVNEHSDQR